MSDLVDWPEEFRLGMERAKAHHGCTCPEFDDYYTGPNPDCPAHFGEDEP